MAAPKTAAVNALASAYKAREASELAALKGQSYYHGLFPRETVRNLYRETVDSILFANGEFLLRVNEKDKALNFVICVKWNNAVRQFKINNHSKNISYFIRRDKMFPTVKELVEAHWRQGLTLVEKEGKDGPIRLEKPAPRERWELRASEITLGAKIGQGAFGEVLKARYKPDPKSKGSRREARTVASTQASHNEMDVAVKLCKEKSPDGKSKFEKEAMFMLKFRHKHVVTAIGIIINEDPMMIVLEFMAKGSLLSHLKKGHGKLTTARLRSYCIDAARGMEYLEKKNCIHRDVAARNCLVGPHEEVKISDFGLAKSMVSYKMIVGKVAIKWMAPESLRNGDFTSRSDVWAFGVLMWEVFSMGAEPYPGMAAPDVKRKVLVDKGHMDPPPNTPEPFSKTMIQCWEQVPKHRPSFPAILRAIDKSYVDRDKSTHDREKTADVSAKD